MTNVAGELVPGLLHGHLPVHLAAVGVVDGVDHREHYGESVLSTRRGQASSQCRLVGGGSLDQ